MGSKPIGISASRSSSIMGLNPWTSEFETWQLIIEEQNPGFNKKNNYDMSPPVEGPAIDWGNAFEDAIIKLAEKKQGQHIINREKLYKINDYVTCHVDGVIASNANGVPNINHEGKTTSIHYFRDNFGEPGTDKVPVQYQSQVQHQMLCTGAEETILSVLVFPNRVEDWEEMGWKPYKSVVTGHWALNKEEQHAISPVLWAETLAEMGYFHQYHIKANRETQQQMLQYYHDWWQKHIIEKQAPEPKTYDDIKRIWKAPKGTIIASEQLERWCVEYKNIGKEISATGPLGKRREELKILMLNAMMKTDAEVDDDSREKSIVRNSEGKKLISYNGKSFR